MRRAVGFLKRTPCLVLLVVQLAGVLLYPYMESTYAGRSAFALFGLLVLGLTLVALRVTPSLTWVAVLLALPAALLLLVSVFSGSQDLFVWSAGFEAVVYVYAAGSMLAYMLADDEVTTDELFAIPAVFTLLAWAFAYLFVVVQALDPGGFNPGARERGRGWNCSSSPSPPSRAPDCRTSRRSPDMPAASSCSSRSRACSTSPWW